MLQAERFFCFACMQAAQQRPLAKIKNLIKNCSVSSSPPLFATPTTYKAEEKSERSSHACCYRASKN
jgi:hypothetical protein